MSIRGLDEAQFRRITAQYLTPATPISNPEHLKGRAAKLQQIDRAFNSHGRHVFIYGDRGVGKTSLAQSAAVLHQSAEREPILIACDNGTNFFRLIQDIAKRCVPTRVEFEKAKSENRFKIGVPFLNFEHKGSVELGKIPEPQSINDAVLLMKSICQFHSSAPIVIIDEFDQISTENDKKYFADLIKQVSDQKVNVRFIFCGIGTALDELIGVHMSTDRYLAPVPLERLSHDARWEIIDTAATALQIGIHSELKTRIGQISDGYPYYVHLMCEWIFWEMFDDNAVVDQCQPKHFSAGVAKAIENAHRVLRHAYDRATQKYSDDYQEVLWAVADDVLLRRQISEIYDKSYIPIMKRRKGREVLTKEKFYNRMNALKGDRHGGILVGSSAGWYEFRENVVRGYVRLRAQDHNVQLGRDHHPVPQQLAYWDDVD